MQMDIISVALAGDCPYFCDYGTALGVLRSPAHTNAKPGLVLWKKNLYS